MASNSSASQFVKKEKMPNFKMLQYLSHVANQLSIL